MTATFDFETVNESAERRENAKAWGTAPGTGASDDCRALKRNRSFCDFNFALSALPK